MHVEALADHQRKHGDAAVHSMKVKSEEKTTVKQAMNMQAHKGVKKEEHKEKKTTKLAGKTDEEKKQEKITITGKKTEMNVTKTFKTGAENHEVTDNAIRKGQTKEKDDERQERKKDQKKEDMTKDTNLEKEDSKTKKQTGQTIDDDHAALYVTVV